MAPRFLKPNETAPWIKASDVSGAYLLAGDDTVLLDELKLALLRKHFENDAGSVRNRNELDAASASEADINDSLETLPLFSEKTAVVIRNADKLNAKKFPDLAERLFEETPDRLVILTSQKSSSDLGKIAIAKKFLAKNRAVFFYAPRNDRDGMQWVMSFCKRHKIDISTTGARLIVDLVGYDTCEIVQELRKICVTCGRSITDDVIREQIVSHRENSSFACAEAIVAGRPEGLRLIAEVTEFGTKSVALLPLINLKLTDIELARSGAPMAPWRKRSVERFTKNWDDRKIHQARSILLDLDLSLKSISKETALARTELAAARLIELTSQRS